MDISKYLEDNIHSLIIQSEVPEVCKNEVCCLGIDEAGRGPVLGPMVYGICYCPVSRKERLANLGFADSKTLTEEKRDNLLKVIEENADFIGWAIKIISPTQISNDMLRRAKISLNELSHGAAIELTKKTIADGADIKEMFVDTVGDATKYQDMLSKVFGDVQVTVESKADAKFPIVSAASICAKVARDRCIAGWNFSEGADFNTDYGSGYPSDPTVKKWLKDNMDTVFGYPQFVRTSWSTAYTILDSSAATVSWEDEDIDESARGTASITTFFAQKDAPKTVDHCKFFIERHLAQCVDL